MVSPPYFNNEGLRYGASVRSAIARIGAVEATGLAGESSGEHFCRSRQFGESIRPCGDPFLMMLVRALCQLRL
jgi:hypothetical protein